MSKLNTLPIRSIPETGMDSEQLLEILASLRQGDVDWRKGRAWSLVYHAGDEHERLLERAYSLFLSENGLNPMAFKSLRRMEAEVVRMTANMLNGPEAVGSMTSGGTESILLAVKTARDRARRRSPWIRRPEIVAPKSIHVAFERAAELFDLKLRHAPLRSDYRVDVKALKKMVGRNTVLIAASAPQYPQGVIDPIEEIGEFARKRRIPFHVDACFGGFILPWLEALGEPIPPFDFRVPGVTSISADVHKYGFAAKGASVLLHCDMDHMRDQFFVSTDWSGGIYAGATLAGTRPGGSIAAAWAAMVSMGRDGYLEHARKALEATRKLKEGVEAIEPLKVLGPSDATVVTYASSSPELSILAVADQMQAKGWHVDRQQYPDCIHCTVTSNHLTVVDEYLADLREAVATVKANPGLKASGEAATYGLMARLPARMAVKAAVLKVMEQSHAVDPKEMDLSEPEAEGFLMQLVSKYQPTILEGLEKLERVKQRFRRAGGE